MFHTSPIARIFQLSQMKKSILEIPALHKVEELARKFAHLDPELKLALDECVEARRQATERHANALKSKGIKCTECDKIFLSNEWNDYILQCSVGCRARSFS